MNPYYNGTPNTAVAQLTVANPNRDGSTGTYVSVLAGVAAGRVVLAVRISATGTTTPGMIRFFIQTTGPVNRFYDEVSVPEMTPSGVDQAWHYLWLPPTPLELTATTTILRASTENAEVFDLVVSYGDRT